MSKGGGERSVVSQRWMILMIKSKNCIFLIFFLIVKKNLKLLRDDMGGKNSKPKAARKASAMDAAAKYEDTDEVVMDPNGLPEGYVCLCNGAVTSSLFLF